MKKMSVLVPILLSACGGMHASQFTTPDGRTGYTLSCSEFYRTQADCQVKAGEYCAHGYEVDHRLSYRETYADSGDGTHMPARNHLVFTCNKAAS